MTSIETAEFNTTLVEHVVGRPIFNVQSEDAVVVECFATWCPPCVAILPHLISLQITNPNVRFFQLSNEPVSKLKAFFKGKEEQFKALKLPETPPYTVGTSEDVFDAFMGQFNVKGIPHAFIIEKGNVIWHGHPREPEFQSIVQKLNEKYKPEETTNE